MQLVTIPMEATLARADLATLEMERHAQMSMSAVTMLTTVSRIQLVTTQMEVTTVLAMPV